MYSPADIDWHTLTNEQKALGYLREARAAMEDVRKLDNRPSRELSVAFTECESAILWLQSHMQRNPITPQDFASPPPANSGTDANGSPVCGEQLSRDLTDQARSEALGG